MHIPNGFYSKWFGYRRYQNKQDSNRPTRRRVFLVGSGALVAAGCDRRASLRSPIRLLLSGNAASPSYLPHTIAQQLKLYEAQGLQVIFDNVPGGTRGAQALVGGSADAVIGYFEQPFRLTAQGQITQAFAVLTRYPGNVLITSGRSASVHSLRDLKHKKVGVSDVGSQNHFFLNWVLTRNGISPTDVTVVPTGSHTSALAALQQGTLDAWSGFDPVATVFQSRNPDAQVLADARTEQGVREIFGSANYPGSVLYAKANWLRKDPDLARRLAQALVASLRWIHERTVDQIMEVVPPSYIGEDRSVYRTVLSRSMSMFTDDGRMPLEAPGLVKQVLGVSLQDVRKNGFELTRTYTNEYVSRR